MVILGVSLRKSELYYSVIEGQEKREAKLLELNKINVRTAESIPELMNWFESNFLEILARFKPTKVGYKLHLNTKKDQMTYLQFPLGVLNLVCQKQGILPTPRSTNYITPQRRTIAKRYFERFRKNLKDPELDALVVAWDEMDGA